MGGSQPRSSDEESPLEQPLLAQQSASPARPTDRLRRVDTAVALGGTGFLGVGSALLITLYVTGPPRFDDLAANTTIVLFLTLLAGCACCLPSWAAALLILLGAKPASGEPPPHSRLLRIATLLALLFATLHAFAGVVLYVLLEGQASFVSFCLQNLSTAVPDACTDRWNRNWVTIVSVILVLLFHVGLGFQVFRYASA
ncbi:hypothetical protein JCM8202_003928 [Rhodotorula sphaerocarpa]